MLSWLVYPILLPLAVFLPEAVASHPTSNGKLPAAAADECTTFPSWTVTGFRSNSTDAVGGSGARASFTLTNNLSGTTDELACDLQVNYRCVIAGTPSDEGLTVHLAIRADSLTFQLAKVVAECPGRTTYVSFWITSCACLGGRH